MKKLLFLLPAVLILAAFPLFSQETVLDHEDQTESEVILPDNDRLYVIAAFEFDIKGRTRPYALVYAGEFREGEKLRGQANLEKYIEDKTQLLINQRVLKDNAAISYSIGEQLENGAYPVTLTLKVEDSWNVIILPYPQYSSHTGLGLTVKARDYNFLGTMNPLRIDLGYSYDENNRSSFILGVFSSTPFRALGYTWKFRFDNTFNYRPDVDEPYYYQNVTGLSVEVPFRTTTFTFGFDETFNFNEENSDRYKIQYGEFQNGWYMSSHLFTSWEIPTGLVFRYGELTYTPDISATFNHELPDWPLQEFRRGPFMGFGHSLGFEKIDWHANYRQGLSVFVSNSYNYDFFRLNNDQNPLSVSYAFKGAGHFIISRFFGISSRLMFRRWFYHDPEYYEKAGDALRGIRDDAISADYMLSLNLDFPLRVVVFAPPGRSNKPRSGILDFELQISPVVDMALFHYRDPLTEISFDTKNIVATGGLEMIIFPAFMRNLYMRLGYVCNLRELYTTRPIKFPSGENREIYLIMGHFY
ncbi:MAG: hypothetical protein LBB89_08500 [Treponema sp.]|nr:hypothetical protein [Treponema sp.]